MPDRPLVYYVTAHGHGHAARSCDILRAVHRLRPSLPLRIVSGVDASFLRSRLPAGADLRIRPGVFDAGLVQRDSVRSDPAATRAALRTLCARWPALVEAERAFLRETGPAVTACDIPGIPLEAAAAEGLPRVAVGNFSWNWIYRSDPAAGPEGREAAARYEAAYARADLLLRLPFHEPMDAFPRKRDVPVVAEPGRPRRGELAARLGLPAAATWVLLSFSSLAWDREALRAAARTEGCVFLSVRPLAWRAPRFFAVDRRDVPFADVLASCDAVVSKPGFGIVSECAVNRKPMVYVERDDFAEAAVLETAIRRHLRHARLTQARLYAGDLGAALAAALASPEPAERVPAGGAEQAARCLLEAAG